MTGPPIDNRVTLHALAEHNDTATGQTVAQMRAAVLGEIGPDFAGWRYEPLRLKAEEILRGVPSGFDGEVQGLFAFARDGITYRHDQVDTQRVQDAWQTVQRQSGKCVDKVIVLAVMLAAMGYVSRFVVQRVRPGEDWSHVYLEVWDEANQRWLALDPTGDGQAGRHFAGIGWKQPAHEEATFDIFKGAGMPVGNYTYGQYGGDDFDWNNVVNQTGNVLGAWLGRENYASTNAPGTYPRDAYGRPYNPQTGLFVPPDQAGASFDTFGTQFNVPWWGWALIGIVAGSYLLGKGRR